MFRGGETASTGADTGEGADARGTRSRGVGRGGVGAGPSAARHADACRTGTHDVGSRPGRLVVVAWNNCRAVGGGGRQREERATRQAGRVQWYPFSACFAKFAGVKRGCPLTVRLRRRRRLPWPPLLLLPGRRLDDLFHSAPEAARPSALLQRGARTRNARKTGKSESRRRGRGLAAPGAHADASRPGRPRRRRP